ncbi:MAG: MFS transporter, partial [Gemmatimonadales bacterium]
MAERPIVWTFVICALLYVMIEQSFGTWLPRFHEQIFGLSAAVASGFMSFYFGSIAFSRFVAGVLVKRIPWIVLSLTYLALAFVVTLAVVLLTSEAQPEMVTSWLEAPRLAFLFSVVGFFLGPIYPTINSIVLTKMPKAQQAAMTGLFIIFSVVRGPPRRRRRVMEAGGSVVR